MRRERVHATFTDESGRSDPDIRPMPQRVQYTSEVGPVGDFTPRVPKLAWLGSFAAIVPLAATLTTACAATQGSGAFVDWPVPVAATAIGSPHPLGRKVRYQYVAEVGPVLVPPKVAKGAWDPEYPNACPPPLALPTAVIASSGLEAHPEFWPVRPIPARSWAPDYPDFARAAPPNTHHPSWVLGLPFAILPTNPAFLTWRSDYPDFARGPAPLRTSEWNVVSTYDATQSTGPYAPVILINGIIRTDKVRLLTIGIEDTINEQPNTCRFRVDGLTITGGEDVIIGLGNSELPNRLFAGVVVTVQQLQEDTQDNVAFDVTCHDYTYFLNQKYPIGRFSGVPADTLVKTLTAAAGVGVTTTHVQAALPAVTIDLTGAQDLAACLTRIANLIGGYWYVDYGRDLHFFLTEATDPPDPITDAAILASGGPRALALLKDLSQLRNRINLTGAGGSVEIGTASAATTIPTSETTIPLSDQTPFSAGTAQSGPQRFAYSGVSADAGLGTLSAGIPQSPSAISSAAPLTAAATLPSGNTVGPSGNVDAGAHSYKVAFVNANNDESELSAGAASASISAVAVPSSPSATASATRAGALVSGTYTYSVAYRTGTGETRPGPTTSGIINQITAPGSGGSPGVVIGVNGGLGVGGYSYKASFVTGNGETEASNLAFGVSIVAITNAGLFTSGSPTTGGALTPSSTYSYVMTAVDTVGETGFLTSTAVSLGVGQNAVTLAISAGDGRCTARRIYRNLGGGSTYRLVATISGSGSGSVTDTLSDVAWQNGTLVPVANTTGTGQVLLSAIPVSADGRVTGRNLYRTKAGGSTYFLLTSIGDNGVTTFLDSTSDTSLSAVTAPTATTANNGQMLLSNLSVSSDPRVVAREIYRSSANGALTGRIASLTNLTTINPLTGVSTPPATTLTDDVADTSLGGAPLTTSTADNGVMQLTGIPLGPGGTVVINGTAVPLTKARRVYRTLANGSAYQLLQVLQDNATTTLIDNSSDSVLGDQPRTESEWRVRAGDTVLYVEDLTRYTEGFGWVKVGSQVVRFTIRSGVSGRGMIFGIPSTGLGALVADVPFNTELISMPFLKGVSGLSYPLKNRDSVVIFVQRNDATAQALVRALEGGDGIHEFPIDDSTLASVSACNARGDAELTLFKNQLKTFTYAGRDPKTRSGKDIVVNVGAPTNISITLRIQTVAISEVGVVANSYPLYTATASITKFSLPDVLRRLQLNEGS
jgi:hypothetical protein